MTVLAVVYVILIIMLTCGIAFSPGHVFRGYAAFFTAFGAWTTGLALAVWVLAQ